MKLYPYSQVQARHLGILLLCARVIGIFSVLGLILAGIFAFIAIVLLVGPGIHFDGELWTSETNGVWLVTAGLFSVFSLAGVFLSSIFVALVRWEAQLGANE